MIRSPAQLTKAEKRECVALIVEGGAVDRESVEQWFPRSVLVAVQRWASAIVGVGVIKPVRRRYTERVAKRSGAELQLGIHELGYITVREGYRGQGMSRAIVQALLAAHEGPLFASTSNVWMIRTLKQFGFAQRGNTWCGNRRDELSLWVRE